MVVKSAIFCQNSITKFQTLTHRISLVAGLHILQPFLSKTQGQPILPHLILFLLFFIFQPNWDVIALTLLNN